MKLITLGLLLSLPAFAAVNVAQVQKQIQEQNADWTAKSTWVSELPAADITRMMGSKAEVPNNLDYSDVYDKSVMAETVDWRNKEGVNYLGAVMNQGNCGSCVAFAAIATLEAQLSINNATPWLKPQLSPQALFACGGGSCDRGWYPSSAASYMKSKGVIDNACAPYTMGSDGKDVSCSQFCANQADRTLKIAGSNNPGGWFGSAAKVKEALKKGPLMTTMTVYEDFLTYSGGVYKSTSRTSVGGHAVSLVGYSDEGRYWIVRNSWGADWGENGYVRFSWDDKSGIGSDVTGFDTLPAQNLLSISYPAENDYVGGLIEVTVEANRSMDYVVSLMKDGRMVQALARDNSINTETLADGRYELVATSAATGTKSLVRGFTVLNSAPEAIIKFAAVDYDLNKPVKGRLEFDVIVDAKPVALQAMDFVVTKLDGTPVTKRTTDVVMKNMKLGFRFNSIPNGEYLIFFRGHVKGQTFESVKIKVLNQN